MRHAFTKAAPHIGWCGQPGAPALVHRFPTSPASALSGQHLSQTASMQYYQLYPNAHLTKPLLLVSDLDDTLTQNTLRDVQHADAASAAFKGMWETSRAAGINCKLAINTGRTLPLFEAAWKARQAILPQPDILIAAVGTRCYSYESTAGRWVEDASWTASMNEGWEPAKARAVMDGLIDTFGADSVEYRPDDEMHEHKLTVLYRKVLKDTLLPHLRSSLQQAGVEATVIEGGAGRGPEWQFIDLLPRGAGKGAAMRYMQQQLGFGDAHTVASGDANNDLLMLQQAPQAILVGNAVRELKQWAAQQQHVYVAAQPIAAGVMEGLQHWGFLDLPLAN